MTKRNPENLTQKGSIMIEALALLGLITMVTPVLYRKAAERATELQDINIATQLRMISNAADNYVKDNYSTIAGKHGNATVFTLTEGVTLDANRLFSSYDIGVRRNVVTDQLGNNHDIYTTGVLGALAENFTMMRSSKIASMIGANGGVYRKADGSSNGEVVGVQGIWNAELKDYNLASVNPRNGSLMVISSDAISSARGDVGSDQALYRVAAGGDKNKMQTTLSMGGNPIAQVTNLVASAGNITIGDSSNASNLIVQGTSNLKGAVTAGSGVTVSGGDLKVTSGNTSLGGTLGVTGTTTLNNTLTVAKATTLKDKLDVSGATTLNDALTVAKATTLNDTLGVKGATTLGSTLNVASDTSVGGKLGVTSDTSVGGKLDVTGNTTVGGSATVNNTLTVGGATTLNGSLGVSGATTLNALTVNGVATFNNNVDLNGNLHVTKNDGYVWADWLYANKGIKVGPDHNGSYFTLTGSMANVNVSESIALTTGDSTMSMNKNGSWEMKGKSSTLSSDGSYLKYASSATTSADMRIDDSGFALSKSGTSVGGAAAVTAPTTLASSLNSNASVSISRDGIIEVAAPTSALNGYIKARRLVSDIPYPQEDAFQKEGTDGNSGSKPYDYYQVNPAYTSVMNDIKLATRGGARLSDILPDFINKGIYVLDNTYTVNATANGYPTISNGKAGSIAECTNSSCVASHWLGFVPTPQCPRNYARAVTVNPIRWRMSEVFAVYNAENWSTTPPTNYKEIVTGSQFSQNFARVVDPKQAAFVLSDSYGSETATHTHSPEKGWPLTFQTNTFLNTSLQQEGSTVSNFQGWHILMGFLYRPGQYRTVLNDIGVSVNDTEIYWNVFPVYAQTMAGFATVYCYFNRHPLQSGSTTLRNWTWGDSGPVDTYDQLNSFRSGFNRSSKWNAVVNDPTLGYTDQW
jgi:hypothetical protein